MTHGHKSELYFLFLLLAGVSIIAFLIFKPFLYALIMAVMVVAVFEPVHKKILSAMRGQRTLAAFFSTLLVLCIVVTPFLLLGMRVFQEASSLYVSLTEGGNANTISLFIDSAIQKAGELSPVPLTFSINTGDYIQQVSAWILPRLGSFFTDVIKIMGGVLLFLVALYYLFKDGDALKKYLIALSPLEDKYDHLVITKLSAAINSVLKGSLSVAIIQGILTSIGFTIFGIPNAVLWGTMAALAALIPALGTGLVLAPGILFLFFTGQLPNAIGLFIWGATAVGLVDNFLGPKLVGRGMHLHPFLALLAFC
jgi:predicted PurR-regulated permease PerM